MCGKKGTETADYSDGWCPFWVWVGKMEGSNMKTWPLLLPTLLLTVILLVACRVAEPAVAPTLVWYKSFGGSNDDYASSAQQTSDGGYIIAGLTLSYIESGGPVYLIKTDSEGNEQWSNTFGGSRDDRARSVKQTSDGGYIMAGDTESYGAGGEDVYLIKTDGNGNELWSKTFGGSIVSP